MTAVHLAVTSFDAAAEGDQESARGLLEHVVDAALVSASLRASTTSASMPCWGAWRSNRKAHPHTRDDARPQ